METNKIEIQDATDTTRRAFLSKAVYAVPTIVALGSLSAQANVGPTSSSLSSVPATPQV